MKKPKKKPKPEKRKKRKPLPLRDKQGRFKAPPKRDSKGRFKPAPKRKRPTKRKRPIKWVEHFTEDEKIKYAWTWKILALVPPTYNGRKEAHEDELSGDARIAQWMHTKFVTSRKQAFLELRRFVNEYTDKYTDIEFKSFTLYQVGGYGPITVKDWIEHESYTDYDKIPNR